jgi:superfamily II DNA/RNA helicase
MFKYALNGLKNNLTKNSNTNIKNLITIQNKLTNTNNNSIFKFYTNSLKNITINNNKNQKNSLINSKNSFYQKFSKFNFSDNQGGNDNKDNHQFSAFDDFYGEDKIGKSSPSSNSYNASFNRDRDRRSSYGSNTGSQDRERGEESSYGGSRDRFESNPYSRNDRSSSSDRGGYTSSYDSNSGPRRSNSTQFEKRRELDGRLQNGEFSPSQQSPLKKVIYTPPHTTTKISEEELTKFYEENLITVKSKENLPTPAPIMNLDDLNIDTKILTHLKKQFTTPTPIQSLAWPIALSGSNLVGVAETGSGKTLGFLLPALFHIKSQFDPKYPKEGPIALIIAPTRELAMQINTVALEYARIMKFRSACLYGGAPRGDQIRSVVYGVELIVATPGRLLDLVMSNKTNLNRVSFIVLDEADRMLDMGFEKDLRRILSMVHPECQTLMWSATWPKEILKLAEEFLKNYIQMKLGKQENGLAVNKRIEQKFIFCEERDKFLKLKDLLENILKEYKDEEGGVLPKVIIFSNYKMKCDRLVSSLHGGVCAVDSIHGDKTQVGRDIAIGKFKKGVINILVATDVAARGLDINDVKVIINFDFPNNLEDYVHRIGRTGRSGKTGVSYSFLSRSDNGMIKGLKNLLVKAEQEIPQEFANNDSSSGNSGGKKRYGDKGGFKGRSRSEGGSSYGGSSNRREDGYENKSRGNSYNRSSDENF